MSIDTWMSTLKTNLGAVSGIRQVHKYDELPGSIVTFPTIIILPVSGDQTLSAGGLNIAHHRVQVNLYLAPQVLPEAYDLAIPFIYSIRGAIAADMDLSGGVVHCMPVSPPEQWYVGPGALRYGDKEHVGIIFYLDVKEVESITVSAGLTYDWYVDSVNGSDTNDGNLQSVPFATIAKLLTVMEAGDTVGLAKGSEWEEVLELPGDNCTVASYGTGNRPHFECRDSIGASSWSKTDGQTNVYEASIAFTAALAGAEMHVWEDGTILTRVADVATCDSTESSFVAVDVTSSPQTLYIHATGSGNPASNGKTYLHRSRAYGIGPNTVNGSTIIGIKATGPLQGSGGIIGLENCVFTDCEVVWGGSHNMYVGQGSTITNCLFTDAAHSSSGSMLVLNQNTPTGGTLTISGCTFSLTSQTSWGYAAVFPFYGHNNVSGDFGAITFSSCTFTNLYSAGVVMGTGATSITLDSCTFTNCLLGQTGAGSIPVSITNSTWTSNRDSQRVYTNTYAGTVSYEDCMFTITGKSPATDGYFYANADGTTLNVTDCTVDTTGVENISGNNRWVFYIDHAGVVLNLLRVTFLNTSPVQEWEVYQIVLFTTPTTWTSDYNVFDATYFRCYYNSTAYTSLATWQAATSQDANSTSV